MIYPEVPAVGKLPDIVVIQLLIMGYLDVAEYDIVALSIVSFVGTEINVIQRICAIASYNGFIGINIDTCIVENISAVAVGSI